MATATKRRLCASCGVSPRVERNPGARCRSACGGEKRKLRLCRSSKPMLRHGFANVDFQTDLDQPPSGAREDKVCRSLRFPELCGQPGCRPSPTHCSKGCVSHDYRWTSGIHGRAVIPDNTNTLVPQSSDQGRRPIPPAAGYNTARRIIIMSGSLHPSEIHRRRHRQEKRNKLRAKLAAAPAGERAAIEAKLQRTYSLVPGTKPSQ